MGDKNLAISIEGNPSVNKAILEKTAELNQQLEELGIAPSKGYRIEPALGGRYTPVPPHVSIPTQSQSSPVKSFVPRMPPAPLVPQ